MRTAGITKPISIASERRSALILLGQAVATVGAVDERQQRIAQLDLEIVDLQRGCDRLFRSTCGSGSRGSGQRGGFGGRGGTLALTRRPRQRRRAAGQPEEGKHRNARQQPEHQHHGGRHAERLWIAGKLLHQRFVGGAADARFRNQQTGGGGDDQCRHLRHQAVADREQRIGVRGLSKREALLDHADNDSANDVDEYDQEARDRVAAHEFRRAVHRAEEAAFVFQRLAPLLCDFLVDQPCRQVGIDRHLLARHGVKMEARCDFGDAPRAFGDDDEIHDHQNPEDDNSDHEIAAHHEIAEGFDDVAGGGRTLVAARQDQPRRGQIQRQPQHGRNQEDGRERGKFQRRLDEQRGHQDQDRQGDRDREKKIEHDRGQREDQHHQNGEDAERQREIAAPQHGADFADSRKSCPRRRSALTRRDIDHGCRFPPRMPVTGAKRLRGGRRTTVSKVRHRTGVHGYSPVLRVRRHSTSLGNFCPVYG
jgi:hypothetical protein